MYMSGLPRDYIDDWEAWEDVAAGSVATIMQQMHNRMIDNLGRARRWYERKSGLLVPDREIFPVPALVTI